jgi:outer membrane protein OmpA-like peptidoglycan-associated protein
MKRIKLMILGLFLYSSFNIADEVVFDKNAPSKDDVITALKPKSVNLNSQNDDYEGDVPACVANRKCRMIPSSLLGNDESKLVEKTHSIKQPINVTPHVNKAIQAQAEQALSMQIIFEYNSAELTEASKAQLKPVGEALASSALNNLSFEVEGHTDAVGSDAFNNKLSAERAIAVKNFLVSNFGVSASQVKTRGKGKIGLLDPSHPESEVNRRVRIVATK